MMLCHVPEPQPSEHPVVRWNISRQADEVDNTGKVSESIYFLLLKATPHAWLSSVLCSSTQELHPSEGELFVGSILDFCTRVLHNHGHTSRAKPFSVLSVNVLAGLSLALWSNTVIFPVRHNCSHANGFWGQVEQQRKSQTFSYKGRRGSFPFPYTSLFLLCQFRVFLQAGMQTMWFLFRENLIFLPKNNWCATTSICSKASLTHDPRYPLAVKISFSLFLFWS